MRRHRPRAAAGLALVAVAVLCACGGAGYRDGVFESDQVRYRVDPGVPGLSRVALSDHDVAFELEGGTVGLSSRCADYEDVPPRALLQHLLFGTTDRRRLREETVTVDGRGALHVVVQVALDGVPVVLDIYVLPKDGCLFDFVYVAEPPLSPSAAARFRQLVESFSLLEVKAYE